VRIPLQAEEQLDNLIQNIKEIARKHGCVRIRSHKTRIAKISFEKSKPIVLR